MTQSANARPCNCPQALEAEGQAAKWKRKADCIQHAYEVQEIHTATVEHKLRDVTRILCDLVSAPSLSVAQFNDPTLERIRLAMLGREG